MTLGTTFKVLGKPQADANEIGLYDACIAFGGRTFQIEILEDTVLKKPVVFNAQCADDPDFHNHLQRLTQLVNLTLRASMPLASLEDALAEKGYPYPVHGCDEVKQACSHMDVIWRLFQQRYPAQCAAPKVHALANGTVLRAVPA